MSEPKRTLDIAIKPVVKGDAIRPQDIREAMEKCGMWPEEEWKRATETTEGSRTTKNSKATWSVVYEE